MSDYNSIGNNSGIIHQFGGRGNTYNGAPAEQSAPGAPGAPGALEATDDRPDHALYAFADIVGYSQLTVRLQKLGQDDLVSLLDHSMAEAGVHPGQVAAQDQGDARLLAFPAGTDAAKVLAVLPRTLNDELVARNRDMMEHAWMRVRLAFSMGASMRGGAGLVGAAPIAVARMANSELFRHAMRAAPRAQCGLLIDDYLHQQWVRQGFRADINPDDYAPVRVSQPDKGFEARAWMKLFGYSGRQTGTLLCVR
jgi:class 3 adenylate cyclase